MRTMSFFGRVMVSLVMVGFGLLLLAACGGNDSGGSGGGEVAAGERIFNSNCALCHGQGGVGKPALGKDLRDNPFVAGMTDDEVLQFLIEGRRAGHPLNQRGVDMPPRGGNPGLSDEDLRTVVLYLRSLS